MENKRKYDRYDTEARIFFDIGYDLKTKVVFEIVDQDKLLKEHKKHSGVSYNISAQGLCFSSNQKLNLGDMLYLEVYIPNAKNPIFMDGEVRWSKKVSQESDSENVFYTGVAISTVDGTSVTDSIHYDLEYKVNWSIVLEAVFGSFQEMVKKVKKDKTTDQ